MSEQQETAVRRGREGGRWINERPTSEEFADWFKGSMKIDPALNVEDYIGGVVLIPALDSKARVVTGFDNKGKPIIDTREELSYVPYAKVETRINYFWDLVAAHEEDWVAVIEHVESPRLSVDPVEEAVEAIEQTDPQGETFGKVVRTLTKRPKAAPAIAQMVHQLPPGFSIMSVPVGEGYSHFLCCTIRVSIYNKADWSKSDELAVPLRTGRGTKQIPLVKSYNSRVYADDSSLMKAETGALGRALGFAGIFVIPGSGVATAEDMADAMATGQAAAEPAPSTDGPAAPEEKPVQTGAEQAQDDEQRLRTRAAQLYKALSEEHPGKAEEFGQWAQKRRVSKLSDAKGAMLIGVVRKLEKLADEADQQSQQAATGETADVPAEAPETTPEPAGEEATGDGDEPSGQAG